MTVWSHSKKQVREALDDVAEAGFSVVENKGRGHRWGAIYCPVCPQQMSVWSTPKSADNHAKQIRKFLNRHRHEDEEE